MLSHTSGFECVEFEGITKNITTVLLEYSYTVPIQYGYLSPKGSDRKISIFPETHPLLNVRNILNVK